MTKHSNDLSYYNHAEKEGYQVKRKLIGKKGKKEDRTVTESLVSEVISTKESQKDGVRKTEDSNDSVTIGPLKRTWEVSIDSNASIKTREEELRSLDVVEELRYNLLTSHGLLWGKLGWRRITR